MTTIQIASDLHLEFHQDKGASFIAELCKNDNDILVLAGDIATASSLAECLKQFADQCLNVVYVPGNHEYYGSDREEVRSILNKMAATTPNFHWLDNSEITFFDDIRFIGGSLWFAESNAPKWSLNDFSQIRDLKDWVYEENKRTVEFLTNNITNRDIVVTHHLPSYKSVAKEYANSPMNPFFVCDVENIILEKQPKYWIHGHTHNSFNYKIGQTTVICNPFGYAGYEVNGEFNKTLCLTI